MTLSAPTRRVRSYERLSRIYLAKTEQLRKELRAANRIRVKAVSRPHEERRA